MKICVVANPRTGSSSLFGLIMAHLPKTYHCVSEPFNVKHMKYISDDRNHIEIFENSDNVFFKNICYQYPTKYESKELWYEWLFSNFDKIVLLDRKNRVEQSESFVYHETKNNLNWNIHSYYDLSNIEKSKIDDRIQLLEKDGQFLLENSNRFPLFYYEDLYVDKNMEKINELFNYLNIEPIQEYMDFFIFSDARKVRKSTKNTKLI